MDKRIFFILFVGLFSLSAIPSFAQTKEVPEIKTEVHFTPPVAQSSLEGNRFEVVVLRKEESTDLYKIDKFTGNVWKLSYELFAPNKLVRLLRDPNDNDLIEEGKINYQLIAISATSLYLVNLNTGLMWEYSAELFKQSRFRVIEE